MVIIKELELKQFVKLFWDKKVFIIIVMILFACIGGVKIKYFTTPVYEASGKLICARSEESIIEGATVTATELTMPSSLAETYAELIKSDLVVSQVIENLGLDMTVKQLSNSVTLTPVTTVYYQVSARSTDREKSAEIANEFIKIFAEEVRKFYEIDSIHIVDNAIVPETAINMNMTKSVKIYCGIGFVVAASIVVIMFVFNNTVTNSDQIKRYTKLRTLASIPKYVGDEDVITLKDSKSPYAESIKILRTNLQYMYDKGELQTVAITSSLPGEGKSWLTANLAVSFANSGKKTLIIDADMRRGRQHRLFKIRKIPGLSEFLRSTMGCTDMITIKGKRVPKSGVAKSLGRINKYIKIDKIPGVADILYKEDYITTNVEDNAKRKPLKIENEAEEMEIAMEAEKKTRGRRVAGKEELKEKTKGRRAATKEELKEKALKKTVSKIDEKDEWNQEIDISEKDQYFDQESKDEGPTIFEFINETNVENLYIIASGSERLESSELLSTNKLEEALEELKDVFDMIIIDTPPVSVVADGFIISRVVDTNIIVLKHGNTEINELNKIKNNIQEIGGEVIGTVINKIPDANKKYYNTYYNKKAK